MQTTGKKKCPVCAKSMAELLSMWKLSARLISGQRSSECFLWRKGCTLVFSVLTALSDCGLWIIVSHRDNAETQTQRYKEELDMLIDLWHDPTLKALAQLSGGLGGWHTSKMAGKCWHLRFTDPLLNLSSVLTDVGGHTGKSRDCLHKNRWWTKVVLPLLLLWSWHIYIKHSEFFSAHLNIKIDI